MILTTEDRKNLRSAVQKAWDKNDFAEILGVASVALDALESYDSLETFAHRAAIAEAQEVRLMDEIESLLNPDDYDVMELCLHTEVVSVRFADKKFVLPDAAKELLAKHGFKRAVIQYDRNYSESILLDMNAYHTSDLMTGQEPLEIAQLKEALAQAIQQKEKFAADLHTIHEELLGRALPEGQDIMVVPMNPENYDTTDSGREFVHRCGVSLIANALNADACETELSYDGVSKNGTYHGNWRILIERTDA
jgi:hypothetical protein